MNRIFQGLKSNRALLSNAASMVGSTGLTSILGFVYWWLAARQFPPAVVGFTSAAISAMTLLGTFSILGVGTLLIGELPQRPEQKASLISTSLIVVGSVGLGSGCLLALVAAFISANLQGLGANPQSIFLFALGVSFTSITLLLDNILIGLVQGSLQLWRNALFASTKLLALLLVSLWFARATGLTIYATWLIGNAVSVLVLACVALAKGVRPGKNLRPRFDFLRKLGLAALKHHALNITLHAPSLLLPIFVTIALSATANAWFYISWNLSSIGNIIASSLTLSLYAVSSAQPHLLARKIRLTLGLGLGACILTNLVFLFGTQQVLGLFGHSYVEQAAWSLRILSIETFPFLIKTHYVALSRIRGRVAPTTLLTIATGALEIGGSALGVHLGGLIGLSLGWLAAMCIEVMFMLPGVYQATRIPRQTEQKTSEEIFIEELANLASAEDSEPAWLTDTLIQPVWLADTLTLSAFALPRKLPASGLGTDIDVYLQPTIRLTPLPRVWEKASASSEKRSRFRSAIRLVPLSQEKDEETATLHE